VEVSQKAALGALKVAQGHGVVRVDNWGGNSVGGSRGGWESK
jgi:hypothetical protein